MMSALLHTRWSLFALLPLASLVGCAALLDYDELEVEDDEVASGGTAGSGSGATSSGGSTGSGAAGGISGEGGSAQGGSGQAGSGQAGSGQAGAGQGGSGQGGSGQGGSGQGGSGQGGSGQAGSGQAGAGQGGSGQAGSGQAGSGQAGSGQAGAGQGGSGQAGSGQGGSGQAGTSSSGGTSSGGNPGQGGTGPVAGCNGGCAAEEYCGNDDQCHCIPGFEANGSSCDPVLPGDATSHSEQAMCDMWNWGHMVTDSSPFMAGPGGDCDPGALSRDGINDTLRRVNAFRWIIGLGPVVDSDSVNNQECAVLAAWNPPGSVPNSHTPPPSAKCYSQEGYNGTSSSNLSWGAQHPAQSINNFIRDNGTPSLGHRRWIFNPPLGPVGVGYWRGSGTQYGDGMCLHVFSTTPTSTRPDWVSWPPPGPAPSEASNWYWSFHHVSSLGSATVSVERQSDSANLSIDAVNLGSGYGSYHTLRIDKNGWSAQVGETYIVTVSGTATGDIVYQVRPVDC